MTGDDGEMGEFKSTVRGDVEVGEADPADADRELADEGGEGVSIDVVVFWVTAGPMEFRCELNDESSEFRDKGMRAGECVGDELCESTEWVENVLEDAPGVVGAIIVELDCECVWTGLASNVFCVAADTAPLGNFNARRSIIGESDAPCARSGERCP